MWFDNRGGATSVGCSMQPDRVEIEFVARGLAARWARRLRSADFYAIELKDKGKDF